MKSVFAFLSKSDTSGADHNPLHKRTSKKKKKATKQILATEMCWMQKKLQELSKQQGSDSGGAQRGKHSGTGLLLSSHSESFIAALNDC